VAPHYGGNAAREYVGYVIDDRGTLGRLRVNSDAHVSVLTVETDSATIGASGSCRVLLWPADRPRLAGTLMNGGAACGPNPRRRAPSPVRGLS
jgi:hypothetical protein